MHFLGVRGGVWEQGCLLDKESSHRNTRGTVVGELLDDSGPGGSQGHTYLLGSSRSVSVSQSHGGQVDLHGVSRVLSA